MQISRVTRRAATLLGAIVIGISLQAGAAWAAQTQPASGQAAGAARVLHFPKDRSLEEIGAPYEVALVDLSKGGQRAPEYLAQNPKGKVPALLRDDGSVLTEFQTIAVWLGGTFPETGLWPEDLEGPPAGLGGVPGGGSGRGAGWARPACR